MFIYWAKFIFPQKYLILKFQFISARMQSRTKLKSVNLIQSIWNKQENSSQRLLLGVQVLWFNPKRAVSHGTLKHTVDTFITSELFQVPKAYEKLNFIITQENSSNWIQMFLRLLRIIFRADSLGITTGSHIPYQLSANTVTDKNQTHNTAFSQITESSQITEMHEGMVWFWE